MKISHLIATLLLSCYFLNGVVASPCVLKSDQLSCVSNGNDSTEVSTEKMFFIPNAFTPNRDGLNDYFKITYQETFDFEIEIYDRKGQRVFYSNRIDFEWDGQYLGKELAAGKYIYVINGAYQARGSFALLR